MALLGRKTPIAEVTADAHRVLELVSGMFRWVRRSMKKLWCRTARGAIAFDGGFADCAFGGATWVRLPPPDRVATPRGALQCGALLRWQLNRQAHLPSHDRRGIEAEFST